jgi:hypothetical protein
MLSRKLLIVIFTVLCFSCASDEEPYLYDRYGFDPGTRPDSNSNYYRQPQPSYPQQYSPAPPYPVPAQPYNANPYQVYPSPGSRFYGNPYAIPPSSYYPPQYDVDQYYVPPTYGYGIENQQNNFLPNKSY